MVCRIERCLGLRLKNIKSNKDDPIVIDNNSKKKLRNEEPIWNTNHYKLYIQKMMKKN
uniref:Uncharacterized protein n=1 Tax=Cucumis melo TaxID=3656 RepID=A0A9I9E823_CUCME